MRRSLPTPTFVEVIEARSLVRSSVSLHLQLPYQARPYLTENAISSDQSSCTASKVEGNVAERAVVTRNNSNRASSKVVINQARLVAPGIGS